MENNLNICTCPAQNPFNPVVGGWVNCPTHGLASRQKPLEEDMIKILGKTYKRLFSKEPTTLMPSREEIERKEQKERFELFQKVWWNNPIPYEQELQTKLYHVRRQIEKQEKELSLNKDPDLKLALKRLLPEMTLLEFMFHVEHNMG